MDLQKKRKVRKKEMMRKRLFIVNVGREKKEVFLFGDGIYKKGKLVW